LHAIFLFPIATAKCRFGFLYYYCKYERRNKNEIYQFTAGWEADDHPDRRDRPSQSKTLYTDDYSED
jgi:hypothetical protein